MKTSTLEGSMCLQSSAPAMGRWPHRGWMTVSGPFEGGKEDSSFGKRALVETQNNVEKDLCHQVGEGDDWVTTGCKVTTSA